MKPLQIGMIGLDTSHVTAFTTLLNDTKHPHHVPGGRVSTAYKGGSDQLAVSYERVEGFTAELRDKMGIDIVDSIEDVAERSDAILLESVDGRQHLEQFERIAPFGKPVFIDKPLTTSSSEAKRIFKLSDKHNSPVFSCSALRYANGISNLADGAKVFGCEAHGQNPGLSDFPPFYWYGIHGAEILFTLMGAGCQKVQTFSSPHNDVIVGTWDDGRIGTVNGYKIDNVSGMGATVYTDKGIKQGVWHNDPPAYALLLHQVIEFFRTGESPIERREMYEIIRFLEAAEESRQSGQPVAM